MNEFEDIEQLLKPQCEFKASETLKQEVMEKAHEEIRPRRTIKLWPWLAAACVIGFIVMYLMPPKSAVENSMEGKPLVAEKVEMTTPAEEPKQVDKTPKTETTSDIVETTKQPKAITASRKTRQKVKEAPAEEPVEMSEETRMELLLASLSDDEPQMEEMDSYETIRQIRKRGERLISMYNSINN